MSIWDLIRREGGCAAVLLVALAYAPLWLAWDGFRRKMGARA